MPERATVTLTRAPEDNASLAKGLRDRGFEVIELPSFDIEPVDGPPLAAAVRGLGPNDRLVFTSRAGVDAISRLVSSDEVRAPVAAIGPATADRCVAWGITAWTPSEPSGRTLGRELPIGSGTVLLARADRADPALVVELTARGARVRELVAYRVVPRADGDIAAARRAASEGGAVIVASPAAVEGVGSAIGTPALSRARVLAFGTTTASAVIRVTGAVPTMVERLDADSIARALEEDRDDPDR